MPESSRQTIYSRLHEARASLERLKDVPAHRLHQLDEQTAAALQSSSSSSSSTTVTSRPPLSRAGFHDVLSSLRQATRSFAESVKPLTAASHDSLTTSSSSNVDRYTSLLREQSQHVAQLASSLDPIDCLARLTKERDAKTLPPSLYVGALRHTAAPLGKRKRSEGEDAGQQAQASLQPASLDEAVSITTALSSALDELAKSLGLETFAEAHPLDKESADKAGEFNTHTLTLGGRILVIDLDLGVRRQEGSLSPLVKVRVSFATDSAAATQVNGAGSGGSSSVAESSSHATKNAKLAAALRGDVEDIATQLFGTASSAEVADAADVSIEEHRIRKAIASWQKLRKNLAALARIDQLSGSSSNSGGGKEPSNLFAQLGQLHEAVFNAAGKSELPCCPLEVQEIAPFTRVTLREAQPTLALDLSIDKLAHGGDEEQGHDEVDEGCLGPLSGRHLSFVARLDPPLVLPRKLAARLGSIVGAVGSSSPSSRHRNGLNGSNGQTGARSTAGASPSTYSSLLSSATHLAPKNTAALAASQQRVKLVPSLDDGDYPNAQSSGAVLVSFFPFQTTRQLFAAIALLQQGSALGRLLRPVVIRSVEEEKADEKAKLNGSGGDQAEKREVTLEEMLKPPTGSAVVIVSLEDGHGGAQSAEQPVGIKLTSQLWDSKSQQMVCLTASVRIGGRGELEVKARLTPDVGMGLGFGGDGAGADDDAARELDNEEAVKIAEQLTSTGDLQQACEDIVKWAKGGEEEEHIEQVVEPIAATELPQAPKQEDEDIVMAQDEEAAAESSALSTPGPAPPQAAPVPMDEDKAAIITAPAPTTTSAPAPRADSPPPQSSEATHSRATKSPSRASPTSPPPTRPMMTRRRSRQQSDDATIAAAAAAAATRARSPPPPLTIGQSSTASAAAGTSSKGATVSPTAGRRRSSGRGASPGAGAGVGGDDQRKRSPTTRRNAAAHNIKKEEEGTPPLQSPTSPSFAAGGPATRRRSQSSRGAG